MLFMLLWTIGFDFSEKLIEKSTRHFDAIAVEVEIGYNMASLLIA